MEKSPETASGEVRMENTANRLVIATAILESPFNEGAAKLVSQLSKRKDSKEFQEAKPVYDVCVAELPNSLALKLLQVYRCYPKRDIRFRSIYLLAKTLSGFRNRGFELHSVAIKEMKQILISCLMIEETQEPEIKIFRRILCCLAYNFVRVYDKDYDGWDGLSDCILCLTKSDNPLNAFHVFLDLPYIDDKFVFFFMDSMLEKAYEVLFNPHQDRLQDWILALQCVVKLGIQLVDTELRLDLINKIWSNLVKAATEIVDKGMDHFLMRGLEGLESFLSRDNHLYHYNSRQIYFLKGFIFRIRGLGTNVLQGVKEINKVLKDCHIPATKLSKSLLQKQEMKELSSVWYDYINASSPLELLTMVASTEFGQRFREWAVVRLNGLLSDHSSGKVRINTSVMRQLQPKLLSCLMVEGISDGIFQVLGQVVNHLAKEVLEPDDGKWDGLRDYFASESKRNFLRAVYVFKCIKVPVEDEFLIQLLPEIRAKLETPRDLSEDDGCWVVAFTCSFSAIMYSLEIPSRSGYVKDTANQMIRSVRELVERGMEVELVQGAFRDLESIVKTEVQSYTSPAYRFIKGLLWRLYEIKGMKMESKMVLWRINVIVDRGVDMLFKELLNDGKIFDWLNQPVVA